MANKGIETVISLVDKTSAPFILFEKKVRHAMEPVDKLKKSLDRLGRVSGFKTLISGFAGVRTNSLAALQGIKNIGMSFGYIGNVGRAVFSTLNKVALVGDDIAKSSRRLGISVESLQKFRHAADLAGVPVEMLQESVRKMAVGSVRASLGVEKESRAFKSLGISVRNADGSLKQNEQLMIEISDKFANAGLTATEKLYASNEIFGRSGSKMIELLNQGPEVLREQFSEMEKFGMMTKEEAEATEVYNDSITRLHRAFDGLQIAFSNKLVPVLTDAIQKLTSEFVDNKGKWLDTLKPLTESIPDLVRSLTEALPSVIEGFGSLMKVVAKFVDWFGVKWPAVTVIASGVAAPLFLTFTSLAKIFWLPLKSVLAYRPLIKGTFVKMLPHVKKFSFAVRGLAPAFKAALGPMSLIWTAFEVWRPTVELIYKNLDMIKSITFDDLIFCIKELDKSFDGVRKTISEIPIIGSIFKGLGSLVAGKVDFSDIGGDDIGSLMLEAENPGESLKKSQIFNSVTTNNVNTSTKSVSELIFKGFPKDSFEIRQHDYKNTLYGNMMNPAF